MIAFLSSLGFDMSYVTISNINVAFMKFLAPYTRKSMLEMPFQRPKIQHFGGRNAPGPPELCCHLGRQYFCPSQAALDHGTPLPAIDVISNLYTPMKVRSPTNQSVRCRHFIL